MFYFLNDRKEYLFVSAILGTLGTLAHKIVFSGSVSGNSSANYFQVLKGLDFLLFAIIMGIIFSILFFMEYYSTKFNKILFTDKIPGSLKKFWLYSSICLALVWLPYLLTFAPGSVLADSFASINQSLNGRITSNHHPVFYTLIVDFFIKLSLIGGGENLNLGVFLYSITQYCIMCLSLGYILAFLYKHHICMPIIWMVGVFYGIMPFFPSYAIIMWKDPLFSLALLFLSFFLHFGSINLLLFRRKNFCIGFAIFCLLTIFLRNNGIYIIILLFIIFTVLKKMRFTLAWKSMCLVLLFSLVIQGPVYHILSIEKPSVEAFSIPLQQIAYVTVYEQDSLTKEEKAIIDQLLPIEKYQDVYTPCLVDSIKWNVDFNEVYLEEHKKDVFGLWVRLLPKHFGSYIKAYCLDTFGFWHPYAQNKYGYIDEYILENDKGIYPVDLFEKLFGFSVKPYLLSFRPMMGSGTFLWVLLISAALCAKKHSYYRLLFYLPGFLCWLCIMIATPVAFSLRYVYILALLFPVYLIYPFINNKDDDRVST